MSVVPDPLPYAQVVLARSDFSDHSTIGQLFIESVPQCFTLEDTVRRIKKPGETAIPSGLYRLILTHHPRFGFTAMLLNVPYFDGIFFHVANSSVDVRGCIGVGRTKGPDWIGESRLAHAAFMAVLEPMNRKEALWLDVKGGLTKDQMKAL